MVMFLAIRFLEAVWQNISNILQELILTSQFGSYFRQLQEVFRNPLISDGNGLLLDGGRLSFFPDATLVPFAEMVVYGFPRREIFRHHPLLNAASQNIENCVHYGFFGMFMGVSAFAGRFKILLLRFHSLSLRLLSYDIF